MLINDDSELDELGFSFSDAWDDVKGAASVALVPVTGGASLLATSGGRDAVGKVATYTGKGAKFVAKKGAAGAKVAGKAAVVAAKKAAPIAKAATVLATAPITGGASLLAYKGARDVAVKAAPYVATGLVAGPIGAQLLAWQRRKDLIGPTAAEAAEDAAAAAAAEAAKLPKCTFFQRLGRFFGGKPLCR